MSLNYMLNRALLLSRGTLSSTAFSRKFLKNISHYRSLTSCSGSTFLVNCNNKWSSSSPKVILSRRSDWDHPSHHQHNNSQHFFELRKLYSTNPSPKPSTTGLADQVLRSSAARDEKDEKKAKDSSEEDPKKDQEKQVRAVKFTLLAFGGIFAGAALYIFFVYGAPPLDQSGNPMRDPYSDLPFVQQYSKRAMAELRGMVTMVTNPSRDKLLPDPVKPPYHQPPYTLLIELTGILVHPDWTYKTGWRFKKRPGVDYFLNSLSGYYFEVVIFTSELGFTAFPIIDALDTQNVVHYRLFRDSTKYENGVHVKDLGKINRDLSKVIAIDWNDKAVDEHRNNAIILPRWKGNDDDRVLFDLAALLQTIGTSGIEDVRGVLEYYSKFEDPIAEFRKKQQELAQKEKELSADKAVSPGFTPASGWLGSLFRKN